MTIQLKSPDEIAKLREANLIVADGARRAARRRASRASSTWELERDRRPRAEAAQGATSAFLGYHGYPAVLCTSVNEVVVHGIPRKDVVLKDGDIIGIDFGCFKDGFCGDSARTVADRRGQPTRRRQLMDATPRVARAGHRRSACRATACRTSAGRCSRTSSRAATRWCASSSATASAGRCTRTRTVPNYGDAGHGAAASSRAGARHRADGQRRRPGGRGAEDDGWTAVTKDRSLSAHFEHSVAITDERPVWCSRRA